MQLKILSSEKMKWSCFWELAKLKAAMLTSQWYDARMLILFKKRCLVNKLIKCNNINREMKKTVQTPMLGKTFVKISFTPSSETSESLWNTSDKHGRLKRSQPEKYKKNEHVNDEAYTSMKGKMGKVCTTPYALIKENGFFLKRGKKPETKDDWQCSEARWKIGITFYLPSVFIKFKDIK